MTPPPGREEPPVRPLEIPPEQVQALEFYQSVFDGHLVVNTHADFGKPSEIPASGKVVFGLVTGENGFRTAGYVVLGSTEGGIAGGGSVSREDNTIITCQALLVLISSPTPTGVQGYRDAPAVNATIVEALATSAWSAAFGRLLDRFSMTWCVSITAEGECAGGSPITRSCCRTPANPYHAVP